MNCKVVKNKVAAPFTDCQFDILYNEGISMAGDVLDAGIKYEVLNKTGNTISFGKEKLGVGREDTRLYIKEHPEMMKEIREQVLAKVKQMRE